MGTVTKRPWPQPDICLIRSLPGGIGPFRAAHIAANVPLQRRRLDVVKISARPIEILRQLLVEQANVRDSSMNTSIIDARCRAANQFTEWLPRGQ
jgi:hypothetical protein